MQFAEEHGRVLIDAGVHGSFDHDKRWCTDEDCIVVVAEHPELGMVGGCRLQLGKPGILLPFELHLKHTESSFVDKFGPLLRSDSAELCGLWVAQRFSGHGVPWFLTAAAVAISTQLPIETMVCFAAEYSMDYACRNGFTCFRDVGDHGGFTFPTPDIKSYMLVNSDPISLHYALTEERQRLISLRLNPNQSRIELMKGRPFEVFYCLKLPQKVIPMHPPMSDENDLKRRTA